MDGEVSLFLLVLQKKVIDSEMLQKLASASRRRFSFQYLNLFGFIVNCSVIIVCILSSREPSFEVCWSAGSVLL